MSKSIEKYFVAVTLHDANGDPTETIACGEFNNLFPAMAIFGQELSLLTDTHLANGGDGGEVALFTRVGEGQVDIVRALVKFEQHCRVCGCTEWDCSGCMARTGERCDWVEQDLCSACVGVEKGTDD